MHDRAALGGKPGEAMPDLDRRAFAARGIGALAALGLRVPPAHAQASPAEILPHVDPALRPAAEQMLRLSGNTRLINDAGLAELRRGESAYAPPRAPDIAVEERHVAIGGGAPEVTLYVVNARPGTRRPGILHTHGGGYIAGAAKWEIRYLQDIARELDCVVVSVEYRLAPETRYTGSIEDNYAGLRWMHGAADQLGLDRARIALMGESAGGGHAARLAITARDRGEVPIALQVLVYPMLDDRTGSTRQMPPYIGAIGWTAEANRYGWRSFLGREPGRPDVPPAAVPARVSDLHGLPPAWIGVGGIDLFVSEDLNYARRLIQAAVPTELLVVPGAFHGFDRIAGDTAPARRFTRSKMNALRRAFGMPQQG